MAANKNKSWGPGSGDAWPPEATYGTYHAWRLMRMWLRENAGIFDPRYLKETP